MLRACAHFCKQKVKMDPLTLIPEELFYLIYQHFSLDELLYLSEVSKKWYEMIGQSKVFMNKVWINVDDRYAEPSREIVKIFQSSDRNYENFKISELGSGLEIVNNPRRQWKRGQINIQSFLTSLDFFKILKLIENDIFYLEIFDMDIQVDKDSSLKCYQLSFVKLQRLYFGCGSIELITPFINSVNSLNTLILEGINLNHQSVNMLSEFFKSIKMLKKLQLPVEIFSLLLNVNNKVEFSLEYLCLDFSDGKLTNLKDFRHFLRNQFTLSWIKLIDCSNCGYLDVILKYSLSITRLSLEYFDKDSQKIKSEDLSKINNKLILQLQKEKKMDSILCTKQWNEVRIGKHEND